MELNKKQLLFFVIAVISLPVQAQLFSIKGKLIDDAKEALYGATIFLLNQRDSSLVKGTTSDERGTFELNNVSSNNYILKVVSLTSHSFYQSISVFQNLDIGTITLKTSTKNLKEIEVKTSISIATQNGDTTSYNSKAFKTNKDATAEDLLSKMPGVATVDGKIQAQGEEVKQVLVDGKPFFGDDPNSVLKNLPAEIIEKVQVFDKKSDQSQFTGIDDGNTIKTINIVTKIQFRNGIFGKVYGGYGTENKFKGGGVINRFKEKQRVTLLLLSNNINEQNFSTEDLLGVMSTSSSNGRRGPGAGGRGRSGGQQSSDNFLVNVQNGIIHTNALGLNYSDSWGKKTTVSGSYFYNQTNNTAETDLIRRYVSGGNNNLVYTEESNGQSINDNHRINLRLECKIDSLNTLILQPKFSMQLNKGISDLHGENEKQILLSDINNSFNSNLTALNFSMPFQLRHAFRKKGRTISLDVNPSYNSSSGNSKLTTYNNFYVDSVYTDTLDQKSTLSKSGINSNTNLTYTEPVLKNSFLSINYLLTYNISDAKKNTFNRNPSDLNFTETDSLLSNIFNSFYSAHLVGINYRFQKEKVNFTLGLSGQQAELYKSQKFPSAFEGTRTFESVLPSAQFQYKFSKTNNIRMNYRTNNTAPTIEQLQNVINNSNSLQLTTGNSDLKQNFQNNFSVRYSGVNTGKSTSVFVLLGGSFTENYIGNSTIIAGRDTTVFNSVFLPRGSQITRPENLQNYYNLRFFFNYSFALKKLKSNVNINAGYTYNNIPALINNKSNYSNTSAPSFGLVISSNISENVDFTLSSNSNYHAVTNSLNTDLNTAYLNQVSKAKVNFNFLKSIVFTAEYNNTIYTGLSDGFNQNISLFNAALGYKFLKDKNADLRLFVFDVFKQNNSIQRNITESYIEDVQTTILQQYFMLIFTYNFKKYYKNETKNQHD